MSIGTFDSLKPHNDIGFKLWQSCNRWQQIVTRALSPLNLTHVQYVLLAGVGHLSHTENNVTQYKLAQHTRTNIMMTSKVLRSLEGKNLLIRAKSKLDLRAKVLIMTQKGHKRLQEAQLVMTDIERLLFDKYDHESLNKWLDSMLTEGVVNDL